MHKIKNFSHFKKKYVDVQNFLCIYTNHHVDVGTLSWPGGRVAQFRYRPPVSIIPT